MAALLLIGVATLTAVALARTDGIRERAETALESGMPPREAALARGFVLGQDEQIDDATVEDFRRSGLSHLLAVSGQNVALLALLAMPVLAAFGVPLRARLVWILTLIAIYVPLTGAGPSIQRAGVMGALSVLATLAGRRASRFYGLLVAAFVTLAIDPGIAADIGWQLSFAAVLGILLLASPLRAAIEARVGGGRSLARTLAEGAAMTIAATLATAPLIAFHFGKLSTATLLANLLALPAIAPAMWLGMLSIAAGQVPGFPVEALNALNAPLLGYVAQVAAWCGRPSWAYMDVGLSGVGLALSYLAIAIVAIAAIRLGRRYRVARLRRDRGRQRSIRTLDARGIAQRKRRLALAMLLVAGVALVGMDLGQGGGASGAPASGLRVSVLDVGQGDSILLQPAGAPAVLVDGGPAGAGLVAKLDEAGVDRLGAVLVTHDQSDHAGGVAELLGRLPIGRLLYGVLGSETLGLAREAGVPAQRIAEGAVLRSGSLRLEAIWPPPELLGPPGPGDDPNRLAVVTVARWRDFSMLLSADAEAEATVLDPGPVDVLKVAHHGSEDGGLDGLLDRASPALAVVSVGGDNSYGHPSPATVAALAEHDVEVLRTDLDGTISIDVGRGSFEVSSDD